MLPESAEAMMPGALKWGDWGSPESPLGIGYTAPKGRTSERPYA